MNGVSPPTGCGKTAGDLRRDVEELQERIKANADELKAAEIEAELPSLQAAVDDTFAKAKAEEAAHRERMAPLREANQKAIDAYDAQKNTPAELRNSAHRIYGKTMSPENRKEFERVSDAATKSHNLWRQLEDRRKYLTASAESAANMVEAAKLRLESLNDKPNAEQAVANAAADLKRAEASPKTRRTQPGGNRGGMLPRRGLGRFEQLRCGTSGHLLAAGLVVPFSYQHLPQLQPPAEQLEQRAKQLIRFVRIVGQFNRDAMLGDFDFD